MEIKFDKFEEQAFLNTVLIENLTDNETGTGFLISKPMGEKQKILLFSNKHVFWGKKDKDKKDIEKTIRLTLHKLDEDGSYKLGGVHAFMGKIKRSPENGYYEHPDESVDVACVNISHLNNQGIKLNLHYLIIEDFCRFKREELFAGMKILFVGYPSGFYDKANFLPVMRSGTIASIPVVDFDGKPNILLDAQVFPGSSGSPVFASIKGQYQLLGIISSGVRKGLDFIEIDNSSESTENQKKANVPVEWLGLGLLFTNDTIIEIYNLA
jgi:V8-like Glu-specific endopeptidase